MAGFDAADGDLVLRLVTGAVVLAPSGLILVILVCEALACGMSMARQAIAKVPMICQESVVVGREALMTALDSVALTYTVERDGTLVVHVPVDGAHQQDVYIVPDASEVFSTVSRVGSGSPKNHTFARLSPAPGFDVAVLRRNGREELALCARVPRGSKPQRTMKLIRRIASECHKALAS